MNKYQKAFNRLTLSENWWIEEEDVKTIRELVDKATPKKPKLMNCGKCGTRLGDNNGWTKVIIRFCSYCGQRVDWSEEE